MERVVLDWKDGETFELGGCRFTLDFRPGNQRSPSTTNHFTLVKTRPFVEQYLPLASRGYRNILELGIFQGGSIAFFERLLQPDKIVGIDLTADRVPALDEYIDEHPNVAAYFGVSQEDGEALDRIIDKEYQAPLDLIIDDASHRYEQTKNSFVHLFPKLMPGGTYIIEDWSWNFRMPHQNPEHPWFEAPAMANLIFELVEEVVTTTTIASMQVLGSMVLIEKAPVDLTEVPFSVPRRRRGREMVAL